MTTKKIKPMKIPKPILSMCLGVLFLLGSSAAQALNVNYDPSRASIAAPVLGAGFLYDQVDAPFTDSEGSPYVFAFPFATTFSITDSFIVGDTYFVYDFGVLILTTTVGAGAPFGVPGDPNGEASWESGLYGIGSVVLAPGLHSITVQGDGVGGIPAGFYDRIDERGVRTPDVGTTVMLLGMAFAGIAALKRKLA